MDDQNKSRNVNGEEVESKINNSRSWSINLYLVPVKLYFFFTLSATGVLVPFIALYMKELELSSSETGIILCTIWFVSFLLQPVIGGIADKVQKHKIVIAICCILTAFFHLLLLLVPSKNSRSEIFSEFLLNINCNPQESYITQCLNNSKYINISQSSCPISFTDYTNFMSEEKGLSSNKSFFSKEAINDNDNGTSINEFVCKSHCTYINIKEIKPLLCSTDEISTKNCTLIDIKEVNMFVLLFPNNSYDDGTKRHVHTNISDYDDIDVSDDTSEGFCEHIYLKNIVHQKQQYQQLLCYEKATFKCSFHCPKLAVDTCNSLEIKAGTKTFWIFFVIYLLGNIASSPIYVMGDAITYDSLDFLGKKRTLWGKQRFWGTLGFALFGVVSTFVMDYINHEDAHISYSISFYILGGFCLLASVDVLFISVSPDIRCSKMFVNFVALLRDPEVFCFLMVVTYFGILDGALESFLYWYLIDLGQGPKIVAGLSLLVSCLSEMLFMLISGKLISKIGQIPCLYLCLAAYGIRFICYSIIDNPWYTLPIELLHGPTFALSLAAGTSYASFIAPTGMSATIQGLFSGLHFGFGRGVGSIITGYLYDENIVGSKWTFRLYGVLAFVFLGMYMLINITFFKLRRKTTQSSTTDEGIFTIASKRETNHVQPSDEPVQQTQHIDSLNQEHI